MEYRELAEENGIENWRRVPALNTDHTFITDMADLVMEALSSPIVTVSEASSQQSELSIGSDAQLAAIDPSQKGFGMDEDFSLSSFKFSRGAELINGRLAMVAFLTILLAKNNLEFNFLNFSHWILYIINIYKSGRVLNDERK